MAFGNLKTGGSFRCPTDAPKKNRRTQRRMAAGSAAKVIKIVDQRIIETPSFGNAPFIPTEQKPAPTQAEPLPRDSVQTELGVFDKRTFYAATATKKGLQRTHEASAVIYGLLDVPTECRSVYNDLIANARTLTKDGSEFRPAV